MELRNPFERDSQRFQWSIVGPIDQQAWDDHIHFVLPGAEPWTRAENAVAARIWFTRHSVKWIHPQGYDWLIDGDQLRAECPEFHGLQWLQGRFFVLPELFGSEVRLGLGPNSERASFMIRKIAPPEIHGALAHFRQDNADARSTAFVLMRFSETTAHAGILHAIQKATAELGVRALRADDRVYHDDLFYNVLTYIYGCDLGIAVFERLDTDEFNPNVALEVGYMLALDKPVCLLKDRTMKTLHTDLIGKLYVGFDSQNPGNTIPTQLKRWLKDKELV